MTTLAKVEANRRNAERSTGPRTEQGKALVALNATTHGIFSNVPVIPGECPAAWQTHRAGVVASLAPVGLLEVNLAERAALLLWRLQRLARYEAETVAAAMEAVEVPPLPPPPAPLPPLFTRLPQKTREQQLWDIREELRKARVALAEVTLACDFFPAGVLGAAVPYPVVAEILETALGLAETAEHLQGDPPRFDTSAFLKKLGRRGADARKVNWTPELILRAVSVYAGFAQEPAERFLDSVRVDLEERAEEDERTVRWLERQEAAVKRLLDDGMDRKQSAKLLPTDSREERVAKYERHLHTLLTSTLHELERLQARRAGEAVPPPAVADVNVTVDTGPG